MSGYVDIHAHVIPGIDDGPRDLEGALAMVRAAAGAGTDTLAATPHLSSAFPEVQVHELAERCANLREAVEREGIRVRLVPGAEASLVWALEAGEEELKLATYDQRGTDLLIETPATSVATIGELLVQLRARGFRITLAHPERSPEFQRDLDRLSELVRQGVLLEVDADALLLPRRGSPVRRIAEHLCRDGLAHVLASAGHRAASGRPVTNLAAGVEALARLVGQARADWMARDAPAAIIQWF